MTHRSAVNRRWTEEELALLRENPYRPPPGRSRNATQQKARELGLLPAVNFWTTKDVAILKEFYPIEGSACGHRLPTFRASACIRRKAAALGLRCLHPSGGPNAAWFDGYPAHEGWYFWRKDPKSRPAPWTLLAFYVDDEGCWVNGSTAEPPTGGQWRRIH